MGLKIIGYFSENKSDIDKEADRIDSLLSIISLSGSSLQGGVRLQHLIFLAHDAVNDFKKPDFYSGWKPLKYGPFSALLERDLTELTGTLVRKETANDEFGLPRDFYHLLPPGDARAKAAFERFSGKKRKQMKNFAEKYKDQSLMSITHDVYYNHLEYALLRHS